MSKGSKTNAIQYLYDNTVKITLPVPTVKQSECNEIAIGDPVYLNRSLTTGAGNRYYAKPIGQLVSASVGDRATHYFAGISGSRSRDGDDDAIIVLQDGVFEMPLNAATTVYPGYVAKYVTGVGSASGSIDVDAISAAADNGDYQHCIGRVIEYGASASVAKVRIQTSMLLGSIDFVSNVK